MIRANLKSASGNNVIPEGSYLKVNGTISAFGNFTDSISETSATGSVLINVSNFSTMSWGSGEHVYSLIAFNSADDAGSVQANPTSPLDISQYDFVSFFTNTALTLSFS